MWFKNKTFPKSGYINVFHITLVTALFLALGIYGLVRKQALPVWVNWFLIALAVMLVGAHGWLLYQKYEKKPDPFAPLTSSDKDGSAAVPEQD